MRAPARRAASCAGERRSQIASCSDSAHRHVDGDERARPRNARRVKGPGETPSLEPGEVRPHAIHLLDRRAGVEQGLVHRAHILQREVGMRRFRQRGPPS